MRVLDWMLSKTPKISKVHSSKKCRSADADWSPMPPTVPGTKVMSENRL